MTAVALTREVSPRVGDCELTHLSRAEIDVERARAQHQSYEAALQSAGCHLRRIEPLDDCPDGVFVEDTVVVLDEVAVLTRPGAPSRRAEVDSMERALRDLRPCVRLRAPATLDGGDVIVHGRDLYVGVSSRSNAAGVTALREVVSDYGCRVHRVPMRNCLHLKTAATLVGERLLLFNPAYVDLEAFVGLDGIPIAPAEPFAANALPVADRILYPRRFERTADRLRQHSLDLLLVDADELAKAEGGVTCCSVLVS